MTGILASVNSLEEARLILNTAVDIIDLKQPEQGALGALPTDTVKLIVQTVKQKKTVSATVGDLPMQPDRVFNAVNAMAKTGVNYIKIGFFPEGDWDSTLNKLAELTEQGLQLIAVLFADTHPDIHIIKSLKKAGFTGVMLDTQDKSKGSLTDVMALSDIEQFVYTARQAQLVCGLAGSLTIQDIPELKKLNVHYLGFRGALCQHHNRTAKLDTGAIDAILSHFAVQATNETTLY